MFAVTYACQGQGERVAQLCVYRPWSPRLWLVMTCMHAWVAARTYKHDRASDTQ
jgi:hypothetical protein